MSLAPLADLKTYLGITVSTADAELQRMLDVASAMAERYTERSFAAGARTEKRSGEGSDFLLLKDSPVLTITTLTIDTVAVPASDGTTAGYLFDDYSVFLRNYQNGFTIGRRNITIVYTAGYATIPADVQQAVIEIASQAFREKEWVGFQSKSLAGETVSFLRNGFPDSAKTVLDSYRRNYPCG